MAYFTKKDMELLKRNECIFCEGTGIHNEDYCNKNGNCAFCKGTGKAFNKKTELNGSIQKHYGRKNNCDNSFMDEETCCKK